MEKIKIKIDNKVMKRYIIWVVLFFVLIFLAGSFYQVPAGERGILLTFGKVDLESKDEGLHLKFPLIQSVKKMDIKTQKYEADASAASRDLQVVSTKIAVNYHLISGEVPILYQEIGIAYQDRIIQPAVQEVVKASTAKFTAEELITKRPEVKEDMKLLLKERLQNRGVIVEDISITNFDFSPSFNEAIEAKVTAEQQKLKAVNDLERIKVEAEQIKTQADAEAYSLNLKAKAIANNKDIVELKQIEIQEKAINKWNGILPQVTGGAIPFIDFRGTNSTL